MSNELSNNDLADELLNLANDMAPCEVRAALKQAAARLRDKNQGKCHWCGDTKADFYHIECAKKMVESAVLEYKKVVAVYQSQNKWIPINEFKRNPKPGHYWVEYTEIGGGSSILEAFYNYEANMSGFIYRQDLCFRPNKYFDSVLISVTPIYRPKAPE